MQGSDAMASAEGEPITGYGAEPPAAVQGAEPSRMPFVFAPLLILAKSLNPRIRGFTTMRYINLRFTYLLTYLVTYLHSERKIHCLMTPTPFQVQRISSR